MPEITDCACGQDHESMPVEVEDGFTYELVCREHKRHKPCRPCRRRRLDEMAAMTVYEDEF